jgi:nitric oxide reductase large subunit
MGNMPWLFFFSALSIPAFYAVGLLARTNSHFTTADFWRFWVVHLWVEDFLELFTTIVVAYIFVLLGVVQERVALKVIYLDVLLYSAGGVVGTMHHVYFSGEPSVHMALGAFFSAAEVIPLTFHRGISLTLLFLATVILISEIFRHSEFRELSLVGCLLIPVGLAEGKLFVSFLTREL